MSVQNQERVLRVQGKQTSPLRRKVHSDFRMARMWPRCCRSGTSHTLTWRALLRSLSTPRDTRLLPFCAAFLASCSHACLAHLTTVHSSPNPGLSSGIAWGKKGAEKKKETIPLPSPDPSPQPRSHCLVRDPS